MTAPHIVDPHGLLSEALTEASPDLMRSMLQALKNPHRRGAPSRRTRGISGGDRNDRLGAVLVRDVEERSRSIKLFIGPPAGHDWECCTIWIRDDEGEREIEVLLDESGREYVLRVWKESRIALGW